MALPQDPISTDGDSPLPLQVCQVFRSDAIYVSTGANFGDGMAGPDDVCLGDVYVLDDRARPERLMLTRGSVQQVVAAGSAVGRPGAAISLAARYTMMAPDGYNVELLVLLAEQSGETLILPLSPIGVGIDYTLVKIEEAPREGRLADLLCISFARGTMITLEGGSQCAIEDLRPEMRVLTRDHGAQALRWVGKATVRAVGSFAPVVIASGTLGNAGDLVVSQHHRMFLYQRQRKSGVLQAELLVQAKHLVDDDSIFLREGGFVDYYSLVFDRHEIIYAEGIPAESLMVTEATVSRLPHDLAEEVKARFPGMAQAQHFGLEAGRQLLENLGPEALFPGRR